VSAPAAEPGCLIDKSVLGIGYSARSAAELRAALYEPPVGSMPVEYATPTTEDRAIEMKDFELIAEITRQGTERLRT